MTDIKALAIRLAKPAVVVHLDKVTGAETVLYTLEVDRPAETVSFERAERLRENYKGGFVQQRKSREYALVLPSGHHTDPKDGTTFLTYSVWKPESERTSYIRQADLNEKYRLVQSHDAMPWWRSRYAAAPTVDTSPTHIIAGAIIPLWHKLKTDTESRLSVVRVCTKDGQRIVGVEIPRSGVAKVLRSLGLGSAPKDPKEVFAAVLKEGDDLALASNLRLKRSSLQGQPAIELICSDGDRFNEFRDLGLINEQIKFKQRFFIPTDETKGIPLLSRLLASYPVIEEEGESDSLQLIEGTETTEFKAVDLESWVLPPEPEASPESAVSKIDVLPAEFTLDGEPGLTQLPLEIGASMVSLLEQRAAQERRIPRKSRPVPEGLGLLFNLQ